MLRILLSRGRVSAAVGRRSEYLGATISRALRSDISLAQRVKQTQYAAYERVGFYVGGIIHRHKRNARLRLGFGHINPFSLRGWMKSLYEIYERQLIQITADLSESGQHGPTGIFRKDQKN
jgi:hypothetical protein